MLRNIFRDLFKSTELIHNYNTRSKTNRNLFLPRQNLNYGKFGARYAGVTSWNELPLYIKTSLSHSVFKKHLKKHLLQ